MENPDSMPISEANILMKQNRIRSDLMEKDEKKDILMAFERKKEAFKAKLRAELEAELPKDVFDTVVEHGEIVISGDGKGGLKGYCTLSGERIYTRKEMFGRM